jgi:hypothetical protein
MPKGRAKVAQGVSREDISPADYKVSREDISPADYKAMGQGVGAQFGTWSVNEAEKTITYHTEGAFNPNNEGHEVKGTIVSVTADEMRTNGVLGRTLGNAVWRRFK